MRGRKVEAQKEVLELLRKIEEKQREHPLYELLGWYY